MILVVRVKPRVYQEEALAKNRNARENGINGVVNVLASGLGKTVLAGLDIINYFEETELWRPRVLVLNGNIQLLKQIQRELEEKIFGDGYSYGFYYGLEKTETETDFLFATFDSMESHLKEFDPEDFAYILVDEAHHAQARTYKKVLEYFHPEFLLAVTATPKRMDGKNIEDICGPVVYALDLEEAIARGLTAGVDYRLCLDEIEKIQLFLETGEKVSWNRLNTEIFVPKRDEEILETVRRETADLENPTSIFFCRSIEHAERIGELMPEAAVIHSSLSDQVISERLEKFRRGEIRTVVAVDMLNEGINIPRTDVVVFLRSTRSWTVFLQQLGRGLRKVDGKGAVRVFDFVGTATALEKIIDLEQHVAEYAKRNRVKKPNFVLNIKSRGFTVRQVDISRLLKAAKTHQAHIVHMANDEMIDLLRNLGERVGHTPSSEEVNNEPGMPNSTTYKNRFGSFLRALELAGFDMKPVNYRYSDEDLLGKLADLAERIGRIPTAQDITDAPDMPSAVTYRNRFGGLMRATELAGLGKTRGAYDLSNEQMLQMLREFGDQLGRRPTRLEIQDADALPSPGCYILRFGSLAKAFDLAGVDKYKHVSAISDDEAIKRLSDLCTRLGRRPNARDISSASGVPSAHFYALHFGSLKTALDLAGCEPSVKNASDGYLIAKLKNFGEKIGHTPSRREVDAEPDMPCSGAYRNRFGGFKQALLAAGFSEVARSGRKAKQ